MANAQGENYATPTNHAPPLLDLTDRPAATPGPLTKPSPTIRPQKRPRRRFLLLAVVMLAIAAAAIAFLPLIFD